MKIILVLFFPLCLWGQHEHIKNLVFEGGGVRGIAYVGVGKALEEKNIMAQIENIAGTSVGGLSAALYAVGYNSDELYEILGKLKIKKFNDGRAIFVGGTSRMLKRYGWYRGEKLSAWIEELIYTKTKIKNMTLKQLHVLHLKDKKFKNLFVTATDLSHQKWMSISYQNFPNMRIADAVRISASIPMYFTAIFMDEQGELYKKPQKNCKTSVLIDGGFISNYPLHLFDSTYQKHETLGFQLDREEQLELNQQQELAPFEIENIKDYIVAFYTMILENLNRNNLSQEDWNRTVSISTCNIGPKIKRMPKEDQQKLYNAGYEATLKFLNQ